MHARTHTHTHSHTHTCPRILGRALPPATTFDNRTNKTNKQKNSHRCPRTSGRALPPTTTLNLPMLRARDQVSCLHLLTFTECGSAREPSLSRARALSLARCGARVLSRSLPPSLSLSLPLSPSLPLSLSPSSPLVFEHTAMKANRTGSSTCLAAKALRPGGTLTSFHSSYNTSIFFELSARLLCQECTEMRLPLLSLNPKPQTLNPNPKPKTLTRLRWTKTRLVT